MALQHLDRLVQRLLELIELRREREGRLFQESVPGCLEELENVHEELVETFRRFDALLEEAPEALDEHHPIFGEIDEDTVFAAAEEIAVWERLRGLERTLADELILDLADYVWFLYSPGMRADPSGNPYRSRLSRELRALFSGSGSDEEKRRGALRLFDAALTLEQEGYGKVRAKAARIDRILLEL
jgi:hypothetical protein